MLSERVSSSTSSFPRHQPEVGQLIRDLRQITGQTQEQFAKVLGVSFSTLNRWENGHMQPSPLALRQVEAVLDQLGQSSDQAMSKGSKAFLEKYRGISS